MALENEKLPTAGEYASRVFNNFYNYAFLGGFVAMAAVTQDWWPLLLGGGLEAVWMLFAPSWPWLKKKIDGDIGAETDATRCAERQRMIKALGPSDAKRCGLLLNKQAEIIRLADKNPKLEQKLLTGEINKVRQLADDFIELSFTTTTLITYLRSQNISDIEAQMRSYKMVCEKATNSTQRELAQKNLDIVTQRLNKLRDINDFIIRAKGQLDLIENSFGLISDQIISMQSPGELTGQLNSLLDGVDAVREAAKVAQSAQSSQPAQKTPETAG